MYTKIFIFILFYLFKFYGIPPLLFALFLSVAGRQILTVYLLLLLILLRKRYEKNTFIVWRHSLHIFIISINFDK